MCRSWTHTPKKNKKKWAQNSDLRKTTTSSELHHPPKQKPWSQVHHGPPVPDLKFSHTHKTASLTSGKNRQNLANRSCNNVTRHPLLLCTRFQEQKWSQKNIHHFETSTLAKKQLTRFWKCRLLAKLAGKVGLCSYPHAKGLDLIWFRVTKKTCQLHLISIANIPWIKQLN